DVREVVPDWSQLPRQSIGDSPKVPIAGSATAALDRESLRFDLGNGRLVGDDEPQSFAEGDVFDVATGGVGQSSPHIINDSFLVIAEPEGASLRVGDGLL